MAAEVRFCTNCGKVARESSFTPGSAGTELALYVLFLLPGLIYSAWRIASRQFVCPICGAGNMVPLTAPATAGRLTEAQVRAALAADNKRWGTGRIVAASIAGVLMLAISLAAFQALR